MGSREVRLYHDHILVKEPGTRQQTPWHQDQPYWPVKGWQIASVWIALDRIDRSNGAVEFVAGSHKWGVNFRPTPFRKGNEVKFTSRDLAAIPDIDADRGRYDIRRWDMAAGDCLVFHAMIVHGAPGHLTPGARRRGLALRYTGDDVRYDPRPGTFQFPHTPDLAAGDRMECDLFPKVWPPVR